MTVGGFGGGVEGEVVGWLLTMPLLDGRELASVTGLPRASVYRSLSRLAGSGLGEGVDAAVPGAKRSSRYYLTGFGLALAASDRGVSTDALLRRYPVTAHWLRLLLGRLETLVPVYRLTCGLARTGDIGRLVWYRRLPLDAAVELADGRTLGVIREGSMAPLARFMRRIQALAGDSHPDTLLVLAPDQVRAREWHRRVSTYPLRTFFAAEREVLQQGPDKVQWLGSFDPKPFRFDDVVRLCGQGPLPTEPVHRRRAVPPVDLKERAQELRAYPEPHLAQNHLLSLALEVGEKRLVEAVALWPLATLSDLSGLLGMAKGKVVAHLRLPLSLGLVERLTIHRRTRFVMLDSGLAYLARRDRTSAERLARQWSPTAPKTADRAALPKVRGSRLGDMIRHLGHAVAVYRFWAQLAGQIREGGGHIHTLQPTHRSQRRYSVGGHIRTLKPDGYAHYRLNGRNHHCFLEWELRAAHPSQFHTKLQQYLAYYRTRNPVEDHGDYPVLMVVLRDEIVESHFLTAAQARVAEASVTTLRVRGSHIGLLHDRGPLSPVWRQSPGGVRTSPCH